MRITCDCDNRKEYNDLIQQLREENLNFTATEQKHITEWWEEDEAEEYKHPVTRTDFTVTFWYSGKLI